MAYIGTKPTVGNFQICDAISVVNGQAAYTMQVGSVNVIPQSANHMIVSLNGTIQKPNSSFTVSGSTITFASNLATGDVIDFIQILGDVLDLGVPSDATVTTAKLGANSVTAAKLNNDIISGQTALGAEPADTDEFLVSDAGTIKRVDYSYIKGGVDGWSSSSGNLLPADASKGIYLGVNSATAANLLDDYEEGTFEATVTCGSGTITVNSSNNLCNYTKIGRMVQLNGSLSISSVSSPSGDLLINGKPFATTGGEGGFRATGAFCMYNPTNGTPPGLVCQIFEGYDPLRIESSGSADRSQADHVQASSELRFTINYVTHL